MLLHISQLTWFSIALTRVRPVASRAYTGIFHADGGCRVGHKIAFSRLDFIRQVTLSFPRMFNSDMFKMKACRKKCNGEPNPIPQLTNNLMDKGTWNAVSIRISVVNRRREQPLHPASSRLIPAWWSHRYPPVPRTQSGEGERR